MVIVAVQDFVCVGSRSFSPNNRLSTLDFPALVSPGTRFNVNAKKVKLSIFHLTRFKVRTEMINPMRFYCFA